jgi:hypothetical protein
MKNILTLLILFCSINLYGQTTQTDSVKIEDDIYYAYKNAMRGVIWAIDNFPYKKEVTYKDIIIENRKICSIKIYRQEGGIKIISTGFHSSSSVEITTYKSFP